MMITSKENWTASDGITLESNAEFAVKFEGNILITAGPGSGKTELLAQKANYLISTGICPYPFKVLAISFKTDSASNLKKRVDERTKKEINYQFISLTYDAFFKGILDRFRGTLPPEIRPPIDYSICTDYEFKSFLGSQEIGGDLKSNQRAFENIDLSDRSSHTYQLWILMLQRSMLTYSMIRGYAKWIVSNVPNVRKSIQITYKYVFLDEVQDTSDIQYGIVKTLFQNYGTKITAVGDRKQSIMRWAGALEDIFERFKTDFNAHETVLLMNHRSVPKLVELQKLFYSTLNENDYSIISNKGTSETCDGNILLLETSESLIEAEKISRIINDRIHSGVNPSDVCILVRHSPNIYASDTMAALKDLGIKVRLEEKYQDLLNDPIVKIILDFFTLSVRPKESELWISLLERLSSLLSINSDDEVAYINLTEQIETVIKNLTQARHNRLDLDILIEITNELIVFIGHENIISKFSKYHSEDMINISINEFSRLFFEALKDSSMNWSKALDAFYGEETVKVMTIHKSKGLEFNTVIILGLENDAFFGIKKQPADEKRTIFVAISRAIESLVFTYCKFRPARINKYSDGYQARSNLKDIYNILSSSGLAEIETY